MEKGEELSRAKYSESSIDHDGGQNMLNKFSSSNVTSKKKKKRWKGAWTHFALSLCSATSLPKGRESIERVRRTPEGS